ncbi:PhzF family phenazine biosynthesis protein [Aureimonas sp. SK2]|uniref:PhzF family phenazine biosynthesis protein n=1 Tax=Aureimonas sp. SK2 TaxID=3015992 RepID=UPI00244504F3|nr:PhzF family phenazine biosynthesis protein [Aureimonas sp. SK2]
MAHKFDPSAKERATRRRFIQCDVFSAVPTRGNGLAVVLDGAGLDDAAMQGFATWTQLAETTFLLPPTDPTAADYRVRIFTTRGELPFAGHPTLGSCAAWLHAGGVPKDADHVRQECAVGIVEIDRSGALPAFVAPPTRVEPSDPERLAEALAALRIDPSTVVRSARLDNGPTWEAIELTSAAAVLAADPRGASFAPERRIGLIGPHAPGGEADVEVRMFAIGSGVTEDPITGSLNAALASWMAAEGRLPTSYTAAQGTAIGRLGRVHVRAGADGRVLIGGATHVLIEGSVTL